MNTSQTTAQSEKNQRGGKQEICYLRQNVPPELLWEAEGLFRRTSARGQLEHSDLMCSALHNFAEKGEATRHEAREQRRG